MDETKTAVEADERLLLDLIEKVEKELEEQDVSLCYQPLEGLWARRAESPHYGNRKQISNVAGRTQAILEKRCAGRWEVDRQSDVLGAGGAGIVLRVIDSQDVSSADKAVAIKVMFSSTDPELADEVQIPFSKMQKLQLIREVNGLAKARHDNIVQTLEQPFYEQGGTAFLITMELLSEGSLYEKLEQRAREQLGPLPELEAFSIAVDLLQGLAFIHERGLVHHDIKPQNICGGFIERDGAKHRTWKLVDFGLVRETAVHSSGNTLGSGGGSISVTGGGTVQRAGAAAGLNNFGRVGTPHYMTPEVYSADAGDDIVSPTIDIWAAGVTLYEMLGGIKPFGEGATDRSSIMRAVVGRLRRGHFVIMPPHIPFVWRIPIGTANSSDE